MPHRLSNVYIKDLSQSKFQGGRILTVRFVIGTYIFRLDDGLCVDDLIEGKKLVEGDVDTKSRAQQQVVIEEIISDLITFCEDTGPNAYRTLKLTEEGSRAFLEKWAVRVFRDYLDIYKLCNSIPFDKAVDALREHYVSQVMSS